MDTKAYQIYEQDKLYFSEPVISHTYTREFNLTDHLGNVRVVIDEKGELVQQTDYYPFGMSFTQADFSAENANKYLYNGKEKDTDFDLNWYHYGFRMYDAALGCFPSLDPKADEFAFVSPYNYAENSPIANIDLWGLQAFSVTKNELANMLRVTITDPNADFSVNWAKGSESRLGVSPTDLRQLKFLNNVSRNENGSLNIPAPDGGVSIEGASGDQVINENSTSILAGPNGDGNMQWSESLRGPFDIDASGLIFGSGFSNDEILENITRGNDKFEPTASKIGLYLRSSGDVDADNALKADIVNTLGSWGMDTNKIEWLTDPIDSDNSFEIRYIKENVNVDDL